MIPRMVSVTGVKEWNEGELRPQDDYLVAEEPLEIRVGDTPISVTMRTPGHDLELAAGFLFTEGLITNRAQIASVRSESPAPAAGAAAFAAYPPAPAAGAASVAAYPPAPAAGAASVAAYPAAQPASNRVRVDLAPGLALDPELTRRNFYTTSSCGVCGKSSIDAVRVRHIAPPTSQLVVDPELLCRLPDQLRAAQQVFHRTGALHAAGLFTPTGDLLVLREDVGRHNAVDKVVGWALANDLVPLSNTLLMVSGRGGFEIVQKALVAGVPILASVSAPSDLAVNLAREFGMTLIGFLRGRRFIIYSGAERIATPDNKSRG